jgi:hypothetical protein
MLKYPCKIQSQKVDNLINQLLNFSKYKLFFNLAFHKQDLQVWQYLKLKQNFFK